MISLHKHPKMIVRQEQPFNAGPPLDLLRHTFITPQAHFFVRNHGSVPLIDPGSYRLTVEGNVKRQLHLSLNELKETFSVASITATLQCAGSRRDELAAIQPISGEVLWGAEPISTAVWRGVPLREVLLAAGVADDSMHPKDSTESWHVAFTGLDDVWREGNAVGFGGSLPLEKALSAEVLLAYEMNGEPLAPMHGFPLRVVVPGYVGARSVKWLGAITVQDHPSKNYFQTHAYKLFPPDVKPPAVNWEGGVMLGELPINTVICYPRNGEALPAGSVLIQGYAIAGGGKAIDRIELSTDNGITWSPAALCEQSSPWTWCFWEARVELRPGAHQIIARSWDTSAQTQPDTATQIWNFKGYANNAWHRINLLIMS